MWVVALFWLGSIDYLRCSAVCTHNNFHVYNYHILMHHFFISVLASVKDKGLQLAKKSLDSKT